MVAVHIAEPEVRPLMFRGLNTVKQTQRGGQEQASATGAGLGGGAGEVLGSGHGRLSAEDRSKPARPARISAPLSCSEWRLGYVGGGGDGRLGAAAVPNTSVGEWRFGLSRC
jgi:hypothetical protein